MNRLIPALMLLLLVCFVLREIAAPRDYRAEDIALAQRFTLLAKERDSRVREDLAMEKKWIDEAQFYADRAKEDK